MSTLPGFVWTCHIHGDEWVYYRWHDRGEAYEPAEFRWVLVHMRTGQLVEVPNDLLGPTIHDRYWHAV